MFELFRSGRKNKTDKGITNQPVSPPSPSPPPPPPVVASRRKFQIPVMDNFKKKRLDSLDSWTSRLEQLHATYRPRSSDDGNDRWEADFSQLFIGNKFATGTDSRIYRGIYKNTAVAVKLIKVSEQEDENRERLEEQFDSEVNLLIKLSHPNVVQIIAACRKPPVYFIITEYMSQGTLKMYLHEKGPYSLTMEIVLRLALDISRGMKHIHSLGVIHRDLKSDNLLLNDEMRVKIGDFGTSCIANECRGNKCKMAGTYRWMAPEMFKEKVYTKKVDIYSFGIVLWELTTALIPFQGMTPIQAAYAACEKDMRPKLATNCSPAINKLIENCWAANPAKRLAFTDIVSILEMYEDCLNKGVPLTSSYSDQLQTEVSFSDRLKGFILPGSSIPLHA
ncbi:Serine/threonine-protein kinase HT1 [Zostera marina]|uniref:non-specific serine/threonine protein kinase n=1 Tax=Zostera marina TaxID=29655 RepID=A0A0K9Q417_ZOSMR|nr:Serine/threonine-protein kinase HT1 [Zostera marina]